MTRAHDVQVMHFVKGVPLLDAHRHIQGLSRFKQRQGKRRILTRCARALPPLAAPRAPCAKQRAGAAQLSTRTGAHRADASAALLTSRGSHGRRVSEAYGRMILGEGLFQADGALTGWTLPGAAGSSALVCGAAGDRGGAALIVVAAPAGPQGTRATSWCARADASACSTTGRASSWRRTTGWRWRDSSSSSTGAAATDR